MSDFGLDFTHLTFIRHGKAVAASDFYGNDFDRPLTEEGEKAVLEANLLLPKFTPPPELILVSTALRTEETFRLLSYLRSGNPIILKLDALYDCHAGGLYNLLAENKGEAKVAAIIGQNPALSQLCSILSGEFTGLAPAAFRTLQFER